MQRALQSARLAALRAARQPTVQTSSIRALSSSSVRRADLVQESYLKAVREYKPTPEKPGEAEEHVQKFAAPSGFKSPEEQDLANQLSEFQNQTVETASSEGAETSSPADAAQQNWFEDEDFEAEEKAAAGGGH